MSKASVANLLVLCAALAACADTNGPVTAPDARPALSEAAADVGASYTIDGPIDLGFGSDEASAQLAGAQVLGAQLAASTRSASGSRSSGHVGLTFPVNPGIVSEKYSYVALSTDDPATPLSAKGQWEATYTTGAGNTLRFHGDVSCMITFGNTARVAGPINRIWRDGVQIPLNPNLTHAFWVVVDNGEGVGSGTPDQVSLIRFTNAAIAQGFCATGLGSVVFPNQEGNIQVEP